MRKGYWTPERKDACLFQLRGVAAAGVAEMQSVKIVLPFRPCPKKNNPRIIPPKGNRKMMLLPSEAWTKFIKRCERYILPYGNIQFTEPVHVCVHIWLQDARKPDLVNILQGVGDMLEYFKILVNDRLIESWDGSRILGIDRISPRTEITIKELNMNHDRGLAPTPIE